MVLVKKIDNLYEDFVKSINGILGLSPEEIPVYCSYLKFLDENPGIRRINKKDLVDVCVNFYGMKEGTFTNYFYKLKKSGVFNNPTLLDLFTYYKKTGYIIYKFTKDESSR